MTLPPHTASKENDVRPVVEGARTGGADGTSTRTHDSTSCTVEPHPCVGWSQSVPGLCPALFFRPQRLQAAWGGSALGTIQPLPKRSVNTCCAAAACPVQAIVVAWRDGSQTQISTGAPCVTLEPGPRSKTAGASWL